MISNVVPLMGKILCGRNETSEMPPVIKKLFLWTKFVISSTVPFLAFRFPFQISMAIEQCPIDVRLFVCLFHSDTSMLL